MKTKWSTCKLSALFFVAGALTSLWMRLVAAQEATQKAESKAPLMVSLTDLKWTELPERKGMEFAILSGDPKTRSYTQMRKVPAGTDNGLHSHSSELKNVIISGVWFTGRDAASARDFGPGSVIIMPAGWTRVRGCRPGSDCVFTRRAKGNSISNLPRNSLAANSPSTRSYQFILQPGPCQSPVAHNGFD